MNKQQFLIVVYIISFIFCLTKIYTQNVTYFIVSNSY